MITKKIFKGKALLTNSSRQKELFDTVNKIIVPTTSQLSNPWDYKLKSLYDQKNIFNEYGETVHGQAKTFLSKAIEKDVVLVSCLTKTSNDIKFDLNAFKEGVMSATKPNEEIIIFMRIFLRKHCVYGNYKDFDGLMNFLYSTDRKVILAYSENGNYSNNLCGWPEDFEEDARQLYSASDDGDL